MFTKLATIIAIGAATFVGIGATANAAPYPKCAVTRAVSVVCPNPGGGAIDGYKGGRTGIEPGVEFNGYDVHGKLNPPVENDHSTDWQHR